jgi:hypothetical protein
LGVLSSEGTPQLLVLISTCFQALGKVRVVATPMSQPFLENLFNQFVNEKLIVARATI